MRSKCRDVIIIGGGLVGLVLASMLVKNGLKITLIEAGDLKSIDLLPDEYQLRVSAINLSGREMFSSLDVWSNIVSTDRLSSFEKMFVWDSLGRGEIKFDCTEIAESSLGYIVENAVIHNVLLNELKNSPDIELLENSEPLGLTLSRNQISVQYKAKDASHSETISAELLVGADGANSWVREKANIDSYIWPYDHQALVTTVETEFPHQKTAWQCFLSDGPLALLPLQHRHMCSIVWSSEPGNIKRLQSLNEDTFNAEITHAFEQRLGKIKKIAPSVTVPLYMRHAKKYINNRIALIGDAAHTIHPLAGQGLNLGFADVCELARNIIETKQQNRDCGEYLMLRKYERTRKSDNWIMIFGMEFFKRLFQSDAFWSIQMRSLGLTTVNKMSLIKNQFIFRAM